MINTVLLPSNFFVSGQRHATPKLLNCMDIQKFRDISTFGLFIVRLGHVERSKTRLKDIERLFRTM